MQIMTGCKRLQAEKCFRILFFSPFSHLTCLHTHNCLRHNKTCFLGWLPCLGITGIPLYGRLGNSNLEFVAVVPGLFTGVDKSTARLNSQIFLMRIYAACKIFSFSLLLSFFPSTPGCYLRATMAVQARAFRFYERTCELRDFTRDEFCLLRTR